MDWIGFSPIMDPLCLAKSRVSFSLALILRTESMSFFTLRELKSSQECVIPSVIEDIIGDHPQINCFIAKITEVLRVK